MASNRPSTDTTHRANVGKLGVYPANGGQYWQGTRYDLTVNKPVVTRFSALFDDRFSPSKPMNIEKSANE